MELGRGGEGGSFGGGGTAADVYRIGGRLDHRLCLDVVEGKLVKTKREMNALRLSWVQGYTSKALEVPYRLLGARASDIDIALDDFGGAALTCIGNGGGCYHRLASAVAHQRGCAYRLRRKR